MLKNNWFIIFLAGQLLGHAFGRETLNIRKRIFNQTSLSISFSQSEIVSEGDLHFYFSPTTKVEPLRSWGGGFEISTFLHRNIFLFWGLEKSKRGQYTEQTMVELYSDPYIHTFSSRAEINYISFPLGLKFEYHFPLVFFSIKGGINPSRNTGHDLVWEIDGQASSHAPKPRVRDNDVNYFGGFESGIRIKGGGWFLSGSMYRSNRSFARGLEGRAVFEGWSLASGYKIFWGP